jgi:site-specific DNA-methyltransferase (adenine-specific)
MIEPNNIYLGDCLELMRQMPDGSIDMIWTDPPYGHSNHNGDWNARLNEHRGIESKPIANDTPEEFCRVFDGMLTEAARVMKPDCCCCCCCGGGGGPKPTFAYVANRMDEKGLSFFHSVIWDKINPGLGWRYRRQHEMVMIAHRTGGKLAWNEERPPISNIIKMSPPRERFHPNEKPVDLIIEFICLHTNPGDIILDPFMGSGSTAVAAIRAGRRFIGFEIDEIYFRIARKRIEAEQAQYKLAI